MRTNAKVYVMAGSDGAIKLGVSTDPARRLKEVGADAILHETELLEHAERVERLAHRMLSLKGLRIRGEWFSASLDEALATIEAAVAELDDPKWARQSPKPSGVAIHVRLPSELLARLNDACDGPYAPSQAEIVRRGIELALIELRVVKTTVRK
jgi:hypothetical protein